MYFGGYTMNHFVFKKIDGAFTIWVKPDISQIICFLENKEYEMCQSPEYSLNIIGEKADIYSLGLIYREFLTFYTDKRCFGGKVKNMTLATKLQVQDFKSIQIF